MSHNGIPEGIPIVTEGLCKRFGSGDVEVVALDDVNLTLHPGEMTLLMGPSGSGKSTMIAALGGLQRPDEGKVTIEGKDLWSLPQKRVDAFRRERCGFVFQSMGLFPSLTAWEQIVLPLQYMGFSKKECMQRADQMLDEVGLTARRDSRPVQMSGGENQRVAIARMLAKEPRLIFADEPTSALDTANGRMVVDLLHRSARNHNAVVLCVTHDPRLVEHADRILTIEDGRIVSDERPRGANGTGAGALNTGTGTC